MPRVAAMFCIGDPEAGQNVGCACVKCQADRAVGAIRIGSGVRYGGRLQIPGVVRSDARVPGQVWGLGHGVEGDPALSDPGRTGFAADGTGVPGPATESGACVPKSDRRLRGQPLQGSIRSCSTVRPAEPRYLVATSPGGYSCRLLETSGGERHALRW